MTYSFVICAGKWKQKHQGQIKQSQQIYNHQATKSYINHSLRPLSVLPEHDLPKVDNWWARGMVGTAEAWISWGQSKEYCSQRLLPLHDQRVLWKVAYLTSYQQEVNEAGSTEHATQVKQGDKVSTYYNREMVTDHSRQCISGLFPQNTETSHLAAFASILQCPLFLSDSGHSGRIQWNPVESSRMRPESSGFHQVLEWNWNRTGISE